MSGPSDHMRDAFFGHTSNLLISSRGKQVTPDQAIFRSKSSVVRDPIGYLKTKDYKLLDPYALDFETLATARFKPSQYNVDGYKEFSEEQIDEYQK